MKLRRLVLPVAVATTLASASPALARNFFVSPGSTGAGSCTVDHDCQLQQVIGGPGVPGLAGPDDDITMAPGTYTLNTTLFINERVVLHGTDGLPRPVITLDDADTYAAVDAHQPGIVIRHVEIDAPLLDPSTGETATAVLEDSTIQDSVIRASTSGTAAVSINGGSAIRNSVLKMDGVGTNGAVSLTGNNELRNVTISGVTNAGRAVIARCTGDETDGGMLRMYNTIASPTTGSGVSPPATVFPDGTNCAHGFFPTIAAESSSFDRADPTAGGTFTDLIPGSNVGPANLAADGIHEVAGSPTIDAGKIDALSPIDFDGDNRVLGAAVDIGADEFVPPPPPPAPVVPVTPAPTFTSPVAPVILPVTPIPPGLSSLSVTGTKTNSRVPPTIHFTLSDAQRIPFRISALLAGRVRGHKCVSPAAKHGARCTSVRTLVTGTIIAARGQNNVGLLTSRSTQLSPGHYRVTLSPSGQSAKSAEFRVTSAKR